MPTERVLIEIVTAANMAGLEQAQAGFLGLTPQIAMAGAALAGLVFVGKSAIENYEAQQKATKDLGQAVAAFNDQFGKTTAASEKVTEALTKAQDAASKAGDTLTIATNAVTKAQLAYTDAVHKHGKKSEEAYKATLNLQDVSIRLKEAQEANADAQVAVTAATAAAQPTTHRAWIEVDALTKAFKDWTEANKRYVPDQYAAEHALASFVRAGEDGRTSMRLLNDSLDLATIKTEGMDEASNTLLLALNGNSKGLRNLGISTAEYNDIMKATGTTQEKQLKLLTLVETKTKDGRKATTELAQDQNALNKDWQDFSTTVAPGVIGALDLIVKGADRVITDLQNVSQLVGDIIRAAGTLSDPVKAGALAAAKAGQHGTPGGSRIIEHPRGTGLELPVAAAGSGYVGGGSVTPGRGHGTGSGTVININVDRGAFIDGPSVDRLANVIAQRLTYVTGR